MAKKKTKAPKAAPLTKVQKEYVRSQMAKVSAEEIAADLGLPAARVRKEMVRARKEQAPPTPEKEGMGEPARATPPPKRGALDRLITHKSGAAVMTAEQSMRDDEDAGTSPFASTPTTQAQRDYIMERRHELPVEQLARDTGLLPAHVRSVIEGLDPANAARRQFMERNRAHLHIIRPGESVS